MPLSHGNQVQGEFHPGPMRRISSGRDRTGSDNIARLFIPWPNEHCLIGVDRKKSNLRSAYPSSMACRADEHLGHGAKPPLSEKHA